jgi:anthranilate synthase component I
VRFRSLPPWGPADLAAALPPGPVALLDGLTGGAEAGGGRGCALLAWAPAARAATLEDAGALAERAVLPAGAPPLLGAVVGTIAWDGTPAFWLPGQAALFDYDTGLLWTRGPVPEVLVAEAESGLPQVQAQTRERAKARPLISRFRYCIAVRAAQRHMERGEIDKLILSVPFAAPCSDPPLAVWRRLTAEKPAGLRFLLDEGPGQRALVGISPEPLVHLTGRAARLHLLAGTRRDGSGLEQELLTAEKDRIEHTVAMEQSRRDLLAVCDPESVSVDAFMTLERHPGLVHLASRLSGTLKPGATPAELIRACFPAGTVGGVPREAAVRLIGQLERIPREWYAGAVGALLPGGDLQLWLTIRTMQLQAGVAVVRTGAGLVPESDPELEWQECCNKARPTMAAAGAEVVGP